MDPTGWRITLVTNLRVLGYVFNPASFYLCRDAGGRPAAWWSSRSTTRTGAPPVHAAAARRTGTDFVAAMDKDFYVSPFIDPVGRYTVPVRDEPERLRIAINERRTAGPCCHTSLDLRAGRLTDRNLARMLVRHPLMTQRTIALIHWHALRLWLRGVPLPPARSGDPVTTRRRREARRPAVLAVADPGHGRPGGSRRRRRACAGSASGRLTVVLPDGTRALRRPGRRARAEIHIHDRRRARAHALRRRARRRRGVHGRPMVVAPT